MRVVKHCLVTALLGLAAAGAPAAIPGPPTVVSITPPPGTVSRMSEITIVFSEPVTGVDPTDLRINDYPGNLVSGSGSNWTISISPPPFGLVQMSISGIQDLDTSPNTLASYPWQYTVVDNEAPAVTNRFPVAGSTLRSLGEIQLQFNEPVLGFEAADIRINGVTATNLIIRPGGRCFVQFAPPAAGPVTVTWAAGHGITDFAAAANAFVPTSWSYTVNPSAPIGDVVITEFVAGSRFGLRDENGLAGDWIELRNQGSSAVNLAGWSLSDDPADPGKWVFPSRVLSPGEFLVVFASGKDRKAPAGTNRLHLNFTLSAGGEFLGLFRPESPRVLASGFTPVFPEQRSDYSYGIDASGQERYFVWPTPGAANPVSGITTLVAPVHFSVERGFFTQPFDLVLTTPTPGAFIRWTTNGTEPTLTNGFPYLAPLRVGNTLLLRAAAFRTNLAPSIARTHSYFFYLAANLRSLPVLSIVTDANNLTGSNGIVGIGGGTYIGGVWYPVSPTDYFNPVQHGIAWERPVSAEYILPADNSGFQIDCGIRYNSSDYQRFRTTASAKLSYRLYFRSDYGEGKLRYPLFPTTAREEFDVITLRAGKNDSSNPFIRDELSRRLYQDMGNNAPQGTFVNLFINGVHKGYYNPTERTDDDALQDWEGGTNAWDAIAINSSVRDGDDAAWNTLHNIFLNGQNPATPSVFQSIASLLDVTNFIDYLIIETWGANWDWPHNNWSTARERSAEGRFRFYAWDLEGSYDSSRAPNYDVFAQTSRGLNSAAELSVMFHALTNSLEFRLLYADRVQKHFFTGGALAGPAITNRFNEMKDILVGMIPAMNPYVLTNWVPNRRAPYFSQLVGYGLYVSNAPVLNPIAGRVPLGASLTMTSPLGGTIYYTMDGSDPRIAFTAAMGATAKRYTNGSPLVLQGDVLLRARALTGTTNWSPLTEATFQVTGLGRTIRISEINFNPPGGNAHEFVELFNFGAVPVDLSGWSFDEGITFFFPNNTSLAPGAYLVLANNDNPASFATHYPGVQVAGWFAGNLANGGERLALKDAQGNLVTAVHYDDEAGWPTAADGFGFSLELSSVYGEPDSPANWRADGPIDGTPGAAYSIKPSTVSIEISEVMADNAGAVNHEGTFPDWVELRNPLPAGQSLAGCSLSDDSDPRKFVLPPGTIIEPNGFLVVWCDSLTNTTSGLHAGFALDRDGGNLFLYDSRTNVIAAVSWGAQLTDFSMAATAAVYLPAFPTPGLANTLAATASATNLVINEWMANPPQGESDWVELFNRSVTAPVALRGLYLGTSNATHRFVRDIFIPPAGHLRLWADEAAGANHLPFRLPAAAGAIVLYDSSAVDIHRVTYGAQNEGVARGLLPSGGTAFANFPGSASPGASNYVVSYTGPVINEVLARNISAVTNAGHTADYIELFNAAATNFPLTGMSLSIDSVDAGEFIFPPGANIAARGYLVVWCDTERPTSTNLGDFNTARALSANSGGVYLFNSASQIVNSVEFGPQVADRSIGLAGGQCRLLATPTPGATNSAVQTLGTDTSLRFNEWMASPESGADWFELFNTNALPVELSHLWFTDDPSSAGVAQSLVAPLSFIAGRGWVKVVADGDPDQGRDHVNFSLDGAGEWLGLYRTNGAVTTLLDSVAFGAQAIGVSQGRLLDGATNFVYFPGSASPASANYLLLPDVFISEIFANDPSPQTNFIELQNTGASALNIGGWFLSDDAASPKKWRVPDGTMISGGGFVAFAESQFSSAGPVGYRLNVARGGEVWLSAADGATNLTGWRTGASYRASAPDISFGRTLTGSGSLAYLPQSAITLATSNSGPRFGPVVINEVHYHPIGGTNVADDVEFIELHNITAAPVSLHDAARPTNTWRLRGGVSFDLPTGQTIPAGGFALLVDFDPANTALATALRNRFEIPAAVSLFGPFSGKLGNDGDDLELLQPRPPVPGGASWVSVESFTYGDTAPWAASADGSGVALQRLSPVVLAADPGNWLGCVPTPGTANCASAGVVPVITGPPQPTTAFEGASATLSVYAGGAAPLAYQWRFNGVTLPGATNASLYFDYVAPEMDGWYDVRVSNPSGSALSTAARLRIAVPPVVLVAPIDLSLRAGLNAFFTVTTRGTAPITYQWSLNGAPLSGATNASLARTNIQLVDEGIYEVQITNSDGATSASAQLVVLISPAFTAYPISQTVAPGQRVTLSAAVTGHPEPFSWEWRLNTIPLLTNVVARPFDAFTFTAPNIVTSLSYRVIVRNAANPTGLATPYAVITVAADADGDGMPDDWESENGLNSGASSDRLIDTDGDGMSNYAEYLAGTQPTNAASVLRMDLTWPATMPTPQFRAVSNRTYTVQFVDQLNAGAWSKLADVVARTNSRIEVLSDEQWNTNRFYRVVTPTQP